MEVLNGGHGGSARTAADHCVLPFHSHVQYYIDKWRDSEVAELVALTPAPVASQARTMAESPSPVSQIPVPSPTPESLLPTVGLPICVTLILAVSRTESTGTS